MEPASSAAPTVYRMMEIMIAHFLPKYSFVGDRSRAPPTAPNGIPEFTRLFCLSVRPRSLGRYRLAPEMRLWSSPDSKPPMLAKATSSHVKCRGSLNWIWKKPRSRPPLACSCCSMSSIRASTSSWPSVTSRVSSSVFSWKLSLMAPTFVVNQVVGKSGTAVWGALFVSRQMYGEQWDKGDACTRADGSRGTRASLYTRRSMKDMTRVWCFRSPSPSLHAKPGRSILLPGDAMWIWDPRWGPRCDSSWGSMGLVRST